MKNTIVMLGLILVLTGCVSTPFTTTFPDGKTITMTGKMPNKASVNFTETEGVAGVNQKQTEYKVSRDNKIMSDINLSAISLGGLGAKGE